jgi:hypothetical protein
MMNDELIDYQSVTGIHHSSSAVSHLNEDASDLKDLKDVFA